MKRRKQYNAQKIFNTIALLILLFFASVHKVSATGYNNRYALKWYRSHFSLLNDHDNVLNPANRLGQNFSFNEGNIFAHFFGGWWDMSNYQQNEEAIFTNDNDLDLNEIDQLYDEKIRNEHAKIEAKIKELRRVLLLFRQFLAVEFKEIIEKRLNKMLEPTHKYVEKKNELDKRLEEAEMFIRMSAEENVGANKEIKQDTTYEGIMRTLEGFRDIFSPENTAQLGNEKHCFTMVGKKVTFQKWGKKVYRYLDRMLKHHKVWIAAIQAQKKRDLASAFPNKTFEIGKKYIKGSAQETKLLLLIKPALKSVPAGFIADIEKKPELLDQFAYDHDVMRVLLQAPDLMQQVKYNKLKMLVMMYPYIMGKKLLPKIKKCKTKIYKKLMNAPVGPSLLTASAHNDPEEAKRLFLAYFRVLRKAGMLLTSEEFEQYLQKKGQDKKKDYFLKGVVFGQNKMYDQLHRLVGAYYVQKIIEMLGITHIKVPKYIAVMKTEGVDMFTAETMNNPNRYVYAYGVPKSDDLLIFAERVTPVRHPIGINATLAMKELFRLVEFTGWYDSHMKNFLTGTTVTCKEPAIYLLDLKPMFMSNLVLGPLEEPIEWKGDRWMCSVLQDCYIFHRCTGLYPANNGKVYHPKVRDLYNRFSRNITRFLNKENEKLANDEEVKACPIPKNDKLNIANDDNKKKSDKAVPPKVLIKIRLYTNDKGEKLLKEVRENNDEEEVKSDA